MKTLLSIRDMDNSNPISLIAKAAFVGSALIITMAVESGAIYLTHMLSSL